MADSTDASISDSRWIGAASFSSQGEGQLSESQLAAAHADHEELREQDRFLPIANVARIMKKAIPNNGKISKEAKECCQECVSEFISFITSEASDRCSQEKRKTINGEDILYAMSTLGFDNYVEPLKLYLQKYRESTKDRTGGGSDDPMFTAYVVAEGSTIIAMSGENPQGQVIYGNYSSQFITAPSALDAE